MPHRSRKWTSKCPEHHCMAQTIWQESPFVGPTAVDYFCTARSDVATDIYRKRPGTTTSRATKSTATKATNTDVVASNTQPSKPWIAGAVIGPIAFIAIIAGAAIVFIRRKHKTAAASKDTPGASNLDQGQETKVHDWKPPDQAMAPIELPNNEVAAHELPAHGGFEMESTLEHELPARNPS
ncbi:hypothetical protein AAP_05209 [Ascosphaera apis ARSEF 7405]|uniref:Uncharacterized protein n=1 Tax=Ascosphaera apis ARSEF 7405 TaxID=392613 RepID=A0A167VXN5_9EURO|nr:hypothetical protein AAP_05209 [Ascosphaera apis ARSEF 7405]